MGMLDDLFNNLNVGNDAADTEPDKPDPAPEAPQPEKPEVQETHEASKGGRIEYHLYGEAFDQWVKENRPDFVKPE